MTPLELDAAQRVIESDSYLMAAYLRTDEGLPISKRIESVYFNHIKYHPEIRQAYQAMKKALEEQDGTTIR